MSEAVPQKSPPKGRPKLSDEEKLSEIFPTFRMTKRTRLNLANHARRTGLSEYDWLRRCIDETPMPTQASSQSPTPTAVTAANSELLFELNNIATQLRKIGVNVNQVALDINRGTDFRNYWRDTAAQLERDLALARQVLAKALEAIDE